MLSPFPDSCLRPSPCQQTSLSLNTNSSMLWAVNSWINGHFCKLAWRWYLLAISTSWMPPSSTETQGRKHRACRWAVATRSVSLWSVESLNGIIYLLIVLVMLCSSPSWSHAYEKQEIFVLLRYLKGNGSQSCQSDRTSLSYFHYKIGDINIQKTQVTCFCHEILTWFHKDYSTDLQPVPHRRLQESLE